MSDARKQRYSYSGWADETIQQEWVGGQLCMHLWRWQIQTCAHTLTHTHAHTHTLALINHSLSPVTKYECIPKCLGAQPTHQTHTKR